MKLQRKQRNIWAFSRVMLAFFLLGSLAQWSVLPAAAASKIDIPGPAGSVAFGEAVTVLPNGNFVVTDSDYNGGIGADAGAVYLYDGASGELISVLTGGKADDQVGVGGVTVLSNGNYVVSSPFWDNGGATNAGAVTWGSGTTGVSGTVSPANSLVGSQTSDYIGNIGVTTLSNGNYVVNSAFWNNVGVADAGAVTWGNGIGGTTGVVSSANSLVGSQVDDQIGMFSVTALSNGNYVVSSPYWDNGGATDAGATTWGDGSGGTVGVVSAANSLVGSQANDMVGYDVIMLNNGNYVVRNPFWDNGGTTDVGAATWGSGSVGITGVVSVTNSLVGSQVDDMVGYAYYGYNGAIALNNGNYVVSSPLWDNDGTTDAGAITWGNGSNGTVGVVSATNSLIGSKADDRIGYINTIELSNGNYVVSSPYWDSTGAADVGAVTWGNGSGGTIGVVSALNSLVGNLSGDRIGWDVTALSNGNYVASSTYWNNVGAASAGAVTWGNGSGGTVGVVSTTNSLIGSHVDDQVGVSITALSNGNYVVRSPYWDSTGAADVGAATWGNGSGGTNGAVSAVNSLVGSQSDDWIGSDSVTALINGNYVVSSPFWDNGGTANPGAATWGNGNGGTTSVVSVSNSLVGSQSNDYVGGYGATALSNGNYVVQSPSWDNGGTASTGAATWGNGTSGTAGAVSASNSLVGDHADDYVGDYVEELNDGSYVVFSEYWDNGGTADVGAVSWGNQAISLIGSIDTNNSVIGASANDGNDIVFEYDDVNHQLVVGRCGDNMVTLFRFPHLFLPISKK